MKKIMYILGIMFSGYLGYALVESTSQLVSLEGGIAAGVFTAMIGCFVGLWKARRWALWLSWALAVAALAWGGYLIHFVWTFWIFAAPTLKEQIVNVLNPRVSVFVIFPAVWLVYFTRPKVRALFA